MNRSPIPLLGALLLVAAPVLAEDNPEMNAALRDLRSAKSHLQAAPHDFSGHRKAALEAVNRAEKDVNEGLKAVAAKEKKVERKEAKAEHKVDKLQKRDQQLKR
jgi:hypothetical protein